MIERACDAAWWWKLDPFTVMALPIEDLELLEEQAGRIANILKRE